MKSYKTIVAAMVAAIAIPFVITSAMAADEFQLTLVSQNTNSVTYSYPSQTGYGYLYFTKASATSDWVLVSRTNDPNKTTIKFTKGSYDYKVAAIVEGTSGRSGPVAPPTDTTAPSTPTGLASTSTQTSYNFSWGASTDNVGVTGYEVFRNGVSLGTTTSLSFNNTGLTCGTTYTAGVRAKDAAGNNSATSTLTVATSSCSTADTTPPVVTVTSPTNGSTVSGSITVSSTATDPGGIQNVTFQLDGTTFTNDTVAPYSVSFDTATISNGSHTFGSRAADTAGNVGVATPVTVTVSNGGGGGGGTCASSTPNTPDGPDNAGGCFPGPSNTGPNAAASTMPTYTGSCTITTQNFVIDSMVVNCRTIDVRASGFVLKNSYLNGGIVQSNGTPSFTVQDSFIDSGVQYPACSNGSCPAGKYACGDPNNATTDCGITGTNYTVLRTELINSNRAAYCEAPGPCLIQDNYFHGTNLWPDASNKAHASSVREEQNATIRHNSLHCSYTGPFVNSEIGCSADLTGYPDFVPIKNNTVDGNLFVASIGSGFCAYGGDTGGKPYSSDPTNATNQKFTNNVFQRGSNGLCAAYGPITDFSTTRSGNVWSGNVWDNGGVVAPG